MKKAMLGSVFMLKWFRQLLRRRSASEKVHRLELTSDGFQVVRADTSSVIAVARWSEVCKINAYKRDLLTYDMICLLFELADGTGIEVGDNTQGFTDVTTSMEVTLGISAHWYLDISTPAFTTNGRVLYLKSG
jgi:hypothetical protein